MACQWLTSDKYGTYTCITSIVYVIYGTYFVIISLYFGLPARLAPRSAVAT